MTEQLSSQPDAKLDPVSAETLRRSQTVKFAPTEMWKAGRPKSSGEFHIAHLCREPGDTLTFAVTPREAGGEPDWMDLGTGGIGAVWVVTDNGNRYGISGGVVYNHNKGGAYVLDQTAGQVQLSVGREAVIPGVGTTSPVKSILVSDEINYGSDRYSWTGKDASTARLVSAPYDPLIDVRAMGEAYSKGDDPTSDIGVLRDQFSRHPGQASFV